MASKVIDDTVDKHGSPLWGWDEYGTWFGTEDMPMKAYTELVGGRVYEVNGYARCIPFRAFVRAKNMQGVHSMFSLMGIRNVSIVKHR